jgi:hypothetical protein
VLGSHWNSLDIYTKQGKALLRTLDQRPAYAGVTVDSEGNLYIACRNGDICEFADSKKHIVRTLSDYFAPAATDASGDVALTTFDTKEHQYAFGP